MAKAVLKTQKTKVKPKDFLKNVKNEQERKDASAIIDMMEKATGDKGEMWGKIIGFGNMHLKYKSGRELDWFKTGFAIRTQGLTLYILNRSKKQNELLKKLGKCKVSGSCLHFKKLADVNTAVLKKMIEELVENEHPLLKA